MTSHVLGPVHGAVSGRGELVLEHCRHTLHSLQILRILDNLLEQSHKSVFTELVPREETAVSLLLYHLAIFGLVSEDRKPYYRSTVVQRFLQPEETTMSYEHLHIRVTQNILLRHPLLYHHVGGKIFEGVLVFPQDFVGETLESSK